MQEGKGIIMTKKRNETKETERREEEEGGTKKERRIKLDKKEEVKERERGLENCRRKRKLL